MQFGPIKDRIVESGFWALILTVLALMVGVFLLYANAPSDGFLKEGRWNRELIVTDGMLPEASVLRAGDRIISVDGTAIARRGLIGPGKLRGYLESPPDRALYEIERDGDIIKVEVPLHIMGWEHLSLFGGPHFILSGFYIAIAAMLFLRSGYARRGSAASRSQYRAVRVICYALVCGAANIILSTDLSVRTGAEWVSILYLPIPIASGFGFGLFLHFFLFFPPREDIFARKPWAIYVLHGSYLSLPVAATLLFLMGKEAPWLLTDARLVLVAGFVATSIIIAFRSYLRAASPVERNQMRWLAWGAAVGIGPWFFLHLLFVLARVRPPVDHRLLLLGLAALPISLLIAISRYRLLEIDGLIRRSLVYTVAMGAMTSAYLVAFGASLWALEFAGGEVNPVAAAIVAAMLLALAFNPLKSLSERLVRRMIYRGSVDPQEAFSHISESLNQVISLPQLAELLITEVPRAFMSSGGALIVVESGRLGRIFASSETLFRQAANESPGLIAEVASRPDEWGAAFYPEIDEEDDVSLRLFEGAALCFPMSVGGKLAGLYLIGEKLSNSLYTRVEVDTLRSIAHHAAATLEHASAYQRLNDLNSELEGLIALRTQQLQKANLELGRKNTDLIEQNAELERLIRELRETQAALVEAERRAAIGEIIITVCHEINNPLTAIMGHTQLIELRSAGLPADTLERVRVIDQCAIRIRDITEKMRRLKDADTVMYAGREKMIDINREEPGTEPF
jgi:hypothetical protein